MEVDLALGVDSMRDGGTAGEGRTEWTEPRSGNGLTLGERPVAAAEGGGPSGRVAAPVGEITPPVAGVGANTGGDGAPSHAEEGAAGA